MMSEAVAKWLMSNDTGISSRTIVAVMESNTLLLASERGGGYPHDPDDLGRCIRLLDAVPSYRTRIKEMAVLGSEWTMLSDNWSDLEALFHEEIPNGRTGRAPKLYAYMRSLIEAARIPPARDNDDER